MKRIFLALMAYKWVYTIAIIIVAIIVGVISIVAYGKNNVIENIAEAVIEQELHLPSGSVDKIIDEIEAEEGDAQKKDI